MTSNLSLFHNKNTTKHNINQNNKNWSTTLLRLLVFFFVNQNNIYSLKFKSYSLMKTACTCLLIGNQKISCLFDHLLLILFFFSQLHYVALVRWAHYINNPLFKTKKINGFLSQHCRVSIWSWFCCDIEISIVSCWVFCCEKWKVACNLYCS